MRFVENDERIVERAAAHECERRDLDHAALHHLLDFFESDDVVERVVQRTKIWIHFFGDVAGKKSESLARFDSGTAEDDALDRFVVERGRGGGDGEKCLAGAGRTDGEDDVVFLNGLQILFLREIARRGHALDGWLQRIVAEEFGSIRAIAQTNVLGRLPRRTNRLAVHQRAEPARRGRPRRSAIGDSGADRPARAGDQRPEVRLAPPRLKRAVYDAQDRGKSRRSTVAVAPQL